MQECCNELAEQTQEVRMIVKTNEMIIGPILKDPPPDLLLNDTQLSIEYQRSNSLESMCPTT